MVHLPTLLTLLTTLLLSTLSAAQDHKRPAGGLQKVPSNTSPSTLRPRNLLTARQTCSGTCAECFGSGYILCPSSASICYKPGDVNYGLDSCTGSSSGGDSVSSASAASPTSTGSAGDSDYCSGRLATCVSCFGEGYLACSDGVNCYNPADPKYDTCPDGSTPSGTPSGSSSTTTTSDCEARHGAGNVPCGDDGCYNPGIGEVCCQDGYYCDAGETCSATVGKCCVAGSTSSGCSGSGSGSSGSGLSSLTSSLRTSSTRTATGTATSTPTSFSNSGTSGGSSGGSVSEASSNVDVAVSKVAAVVLGGFGLFLLAL